MIQINELRVGNLIYNDFEEIQPVYGVDEKSILTKVEENGWSICFKPKGIPLSEDILLKLGFLKYKGDNKDFWLNDFEFANDLKWIFWRGNILENIKYVHQLQNLYFALTGAELTVA